MQKPLSLRAAAAGFALLVVAHAISLMTVQAKGERLSIGAERPQTADALRQIEVTGRQALAEMRRLLGMLRDPGEAVDLTPQPAWASFPCWRRGQSCGTPGRAPHRRRDSTGVARVDISTYRIVQEGLTNALEHAQAECATVRVSCEGDRLEIEVVDDGRGVHPPANGSGHGLSGVRERVALYGGLAAGPRPEGGWALRASLPREPAP